MILIILLKMWDHPGLTYGQWVTPLMLYILLTYYVFFIIQFLLYSWPSAIKYLLPCKIHCMIVLFSYVRVKLCIRNVTSVKLQFRIRYTD